MRDLLTSALLGVAGAILIATALAGCSNSSTPKDTKPPKPSGTVAEAPQGEEAPGGVVTAMDGTTFDLAETYADSPALIIFYRGHW